jgi:hypothetical protein
VLLKAGVEDCAVEVLLPEPFPPPQDVSGARKKRIFALRPTSKSLRAAVMERSLRMVERIGKKYYNWAAILSV